MVENLLVIAFVVLCVIIFAIYDALRHHHDWIYGDMIRKCEKCGKIQYRIGVEPGLFLWDDAAEDCMFCFGKGKRLSKDGVNKICQECGGTGHVKYDW